MHVCIKCIITCTLHMHTHAFIVIYTTQLVSWDPPLLSWGTAFIVIYTMVVERKSKGRSTVLLINL